MPILIWHASYLELDGKTFISNSDAHSLPKMGREYNVMLMEDLSYNEVMKNFEKSGWAKDSRKLWTKS